MPMICYEHILWQEIQRLMRFEAFALSGLAFAYDKNGKLIDHENVKTH